MAAVMSSTDFTIQNDQDPPNNESHALSSSSSSAVFRKIDFHPARKPFDGFSTNGSDFKIENLNQNSGNNKRSFSEMSVRNLFEDGFDPEMNMSITFLKIGAGLENLGNTCFLNSVLQCLTYTEPLAAYLQHAGHLNHCHMVGFCALCAMQKHVRTALQATGTLAPIDLVLNLQCVSRNFEKCRQEDAHEFFVSLLECMHRCSLPYGLSSESSDAYGSSSVHKIFGGSLRSQVKCEQCSYCSNKFEPFLDLSLDISKASSLQKALSRFSAAELLDDGAKVYNCERCKQKVEAEKQLTIFKAPNVLTVHLKRFEAHLSEKINRKVQFPSAIDMKPFVSGPDEGNLNYTLYGVLVHYGKSIHSGHYACFVRTSSGIWYSLDDKTVGPVSEKTVLDQKAYMLFYFRDKKNAVPKNGVTVVKKETSKESLATNGKPYVKDQVNESTVIKACGSDTHVANGSAPLKSCDLGAPAVLTQKDLNTKETQTNSPSTVETKAVLKKENDSTPLEPCDLAAPVVLTQKDLVTKGPLLQANEEGSLVRVDSEATCAVLPGNVSPVLDGSSNTQILVNLSTSGSSPIDEAVLIVQTLGQHREESATSKATSDSETLATPTKTRKRKIEALQMGVSFFKMSLALRKKKKQKRERSSTLAVKKPQSKKRATDQERPSSKIVASACLPGKDNSFSVHSNGNMLLGSPTCELKDRTNQNGAVLASDQHESLESSDLSEANTKRKRESSKEEQVLLMKQALNILTRGLPETVVAKWDEEVSASEKIIRSESKSRSIGYVADEWDEEYDRGKKKKIKMKEESYKGTNPFQLLASKKRLTKPKKQWTEWQKTSLRT